MPRTRNTRLAAALAEAGWSQAQLATQCNHVASEVTGRCESGITRSHVSQWVLGSQPSGRYQLIVCEALSRGLQRPVTLSEIGLSGDVDSSPAALPDWDTDTLTALVDLGNADLDTTRRRFLTQAAFSVASASLPPDGWWGAARDHDDHRSSSGPRRVDRADVDAVRDMIDFFQHRDQKHGGGHGRIAVAAYLRGEVAGLLAAAPSNERVRLDLFSAAGELAYVCGWMAFDAADQAIAQRYFQLALKLSAEAGDDALSGHILRAMAHQAVDLHHPQLAVDLSDASMQPSRYDAATNRERALFGVVHARALAIADRSRDAATALLRAEDDLANATDDDPDPARVFFFGRPSLAHETGAALRDMGDFAQAERQLTISVDTRKATTFRRTHAVTLGYLGQVQAQQGHIEAACSTWSQALETMDGVKSGRARDTVVTMRRHLSPFRSRGLVVVEETDEQARQLLRPIT